MNLNSNGEDKASKVSLSDDTFPFTKWQSFHFGKSTGLRMQSLLATL